MREFGVDVPPTARLIFDWAFGEEQRGRNSLSFSVAELPPTLNHMYQQVGHRRVLADETRVFREMVAYAIGGRRRGWSPSQVMALIFFESPYWLTKKNTMRDADGDNRVKPLFDAIQHCVDVPDYTNWEFHAYKLASSRVKTSVYLFDLGDIVDWYG